MIVVHQLCERCGRVMGFSVDSQSESTGPDCDECCGFGPRIEIKQHDEADQIILLKQRIRNTRREGGDVTVLEDRLANLKARSTR